MHYSIPDTQECTDNNGSTYIGYNLHINGEYHCTVRYRQLHSLNEELKKAYGPENVPCFPPKKYWPLTPHQVHERRALLEKYFQLVGQNTALMNTEIFNKFLLTAQQESYSDKVSDVTVDVFLMNEYKIPVNVRSNESSLAVLEKVCNQINLPIMYMYYFSLFLIKREDGEISIVRKLHEFESPYISQKTIQGTHKIMLRKSYWDPEYDSELMHDKVALNLLYVQTVSDIERGWVKCSKDVHSQLATLQARGAKKEYLEVAQGLKYYGYTKFGECVCDYPEANSLAVVSAGHRELNMRLRLSTTTREISFKITRIRCWRITTHNDDVDCEDDSWYGGKKWSGPSQQEPQPQQQQQPQRYDVAFEYLIGKERLQWITVSSRHAILISVCLQSMVDELLIKKAGARVRQPCEHGTTSFNYMRRDGSSQLIAISQSSSADTLSKTDTPNGNVTSPVKCESTLSMRRLSEKLAALSAKLPSSNSGSSGKTSSGTAVVITPTGANPSGAPHHHHHHHHQPLVENDAFEGIGDDDL